MFVRNLVAAVLVFVCAVLVPIVPAQTSVPQSYTLVLSSNMALEAMLANSAAEIKVSRFGPREFVDVTVPVAGRPAGIHARHWFNLVTHKAYSLDVTGNTCTWMRFTAPDMPPMYDPVATPAPSAADLASLNRNFVRREDVNGIAARLTESSSQEGKTRLWVAVNGNYPVKAVMILPGSDPIVVQEVKQLRFERPPEALLAPPANCTTQALGEWTAEGMSAHSENSIEAHGSGQADLKTGKASGGATVKSGSQAH